MHGKIMEFEKNTHRIIVKKSWNFVKYYDKTTSCRKTSCQTASFLATGGFQDLIISKCRHGLQACCFCCIPHLCSVW